MCIARGGDVDLLRFYVEGKTDYSYNIDTRQYVYKDADDNEYRYSSNSLIDEKEAWKNILVLIESKNIYANVREDIREREIIRIAHEKRREAIKKHATLYFIEDNIHLCQSGNLSDILKEFISYCYGASRSLGIINNEAVASYVSEFTNNVDYKRMSIEEIIDIFEIRMKSIDWISTFS